MAVLLFPHKHPYDTFTRKETNMLVDYIRKYIAAEDTGDQKGMRQIERELSRLGMDKATLLMLSGEERLLCKESR